MLAQVSDDKVEGCLLVGGEVHDLGEVKLVYYITDVQAVKVPTDNQLGGRIPHPQSISSVDYVTDEQLCCGRTRGVVDKADDDGSCVAGVAGGDDPYSQRLQSGGDVDREV